MLLHYLGGEESRTSSPAPLYNVTISVKDPSFSPDHTNRHFYIAHCDDLTTGLWTTNKLPEYTFSPTSEFTKVTIPSDAKQRFYKVVEELDPTK